MIVNTIICLKNRRFSIIIILLLFGLYSPAIIQKNTSCIYASFERETEDSIYIAIHNDTNDSICIFTGFLDSWAGEIESCKVDQMLYLHRYDCELDIYKLSFVPLTPLMKTSSHMPVRKIGFEDEPGFPLTYEFTVLGPMNAFIYPISKEAIYKRDYIYDYHPQTYAFYSKVSSNKKSGIKLYKDHEGKAYKITQAPPREKDWIQLEFAVYTNFDIITKKQLNADGTPTGVGSRWVGFIYHPIECDEQLRSYITVTIPLLLNDD